MPSVNFTVLTSSRTGSTWLIDLLNMQQGVEAHGELFLHRRRASAAIAGREDYPRFIEVHGSLYLTRLPCVFSYLNRLYETPHSVGFKLMYTQLRSYPEILAYLAIRRVRIIHLTRLNQIDVIVSEALARTMGASHAQAGVVTDVPKVHLDPNSLIEHIERLRRRSEQARLLIRLSACSRLEVNYESLLDGPNEFMRVLTFLEISRPATGAQSSLAKRGFRSHRDAIENYDEIRRVLNSTAYSKMLR